MLAEIGLILVLASWLVQLYEMKAKGGTGLDLKFVFAYSVGVLMLVLDAVIAGNMLVGFLNLAVAVVALAAGALTLKE